MKIDLEKTQMQKHQHTAQQLLDYSVSLKQLFQDQWFYLWTITPDNLFVVDSDNKQLLIADGLLKVDFKENPVSLIQFSTSYSEISVQKLADFVANEISFLIRDLKIQHSLFLKTKVQLFRQLLVEEVFKWVDGENRIERYLYNLNLNDAQAIDQIMMDAGYYDVAHLTAFASSGTTIPLSVELNFKHLSLVNSILGANFLAIKPLMRVFDQLCFSAASFIPTSIYRIIEMTFHDHFTLAQVIEHQTDFTLLLNHAKEQPQVLAFASWIKRGYWQYSDIFSKKNFTTAHTPYWNEQINPQFPLFYFNRTVNWLFKQDKHVIDWVAKRIDQINVRVAVTALSFVDTSQIHPHILVLTLKYFKSIVGRLFIQACLDTAEKKAWFLLENSSDESTQTHVKHPYVLRDVVPHASNKTEINTSVLYLEEWLHLLYLQAKDDQRIAKHVYKNLSRVMQAYALFIQRLIDHLPNELIEFIEPHTQEHPQFLSLLQKHQLEIGQFRKIFKHPVLQFNRNTSVFDSYVADYLLDYFHQSQILAKNVTWSGLYQQAVRWHQQIHYQDTLSKLRLRLHIDTWRRVSPQEIMFTERWKFIELNSLEQIIHESTSYKHCLALSYTERIAEGEYVAFHMSSLEDEDIHLTLGCYFKFDQLHFDQLRLPNNEHASKNIVQDAIKFIQQVNQHLIWDFKAPKVE